MTSSYPRSADVFLKYLLDQAIFNWFPRSTTTHIFVLHTAFVGTNRHFYALLKTLHKSNNATPVKRKEHGHTLFVTGGRSSTLPPSSSNLLLQLKGQPLCRSGAVNTQHNSSLKLHSGPPNLLVRLLSVTRIASHLNQIFLSLNANESSQCLTR